MSLLLQSTIRPMVLVANDQFDFIDDLHTAFSPYNYIFEAYFIHPELALAIKRERPDVVILGLQAKSAEICADTLRKLRQQWCTKLIPVIVYCEDEYLSSFFTKVCMLYNAQLIQKPASGEALVALATRLVNIRVAVGGVYRTRPLLETIDRLERVVNDLNLLYTGQHPAQRPRSID